MSGYTALYWIRHNPLYSSYLSVVWLERLALASKNLSYSEMLCITVGRIFKKLQISSLSSLERVQ